MEDIPMLRWIALSCLTTFRTRDIIMAHLFTPLGRRLAAQAQVTAEHEDGGVHHHHHRHREDEDEDEGDGFKGGEGRGSASGPSSRELLKEPLLEGNGEGTRSVTTTKLNPMLDAEVMFASPCFFCG
mmetsp:Transcript_12726/g.35585  ORF Transcript_12726/g.35585 Transcript_12726/m.35585 type:complete len:127 (+) Transcript_12726:283-663(+)